MSVHVPGDTCPGCDLKLDTAHAELAHWFRSIVKPAYPNAHISWAFRDKVSQQLAVEQHKSLLDWPKSAHNHMENDKPCALALDLFILDPNKPAQFPPSFYAGLATLNEALALPIMWGGRFTHLGDGDHFQLKKQ